MAAASGTAVVPQELAGVLVVVGQQMEKCRRWSACVWMREGRARILPRWGSCIEDMGPQGRTREGQSEREREKGDAEDGGCLDSVGGRRGEERKAWGARRRLRRL